LKTNIETISDSLEKIKMLSGIIFNWNQYAVNKDKEKKEAGLIAQEVLAVLPEAVKTRNDGFLAVQYEQIIPLIVEAIKKLSLEIDNLKK
jgi:hypothetical protein